MRPLNFAFFKIITAFFLLNLVLTPLSIGQSLTVVSGVVKDSATKEVIPFAGVNMVGTTVGATADENGAFSFSYGGGVRNIQATAVGFRKQILKVEVGKTQTINFELESENTILKEVVINAGGYRNKGNPAVELIKKVIAHKNLNSLSNHDYYQYNKYEKMQLNLANIGDNIKKSRIMKNFQFIFDKTDTTLVKGKSLLPAYMQEQVSDVFYRKSTDTRKEYILGDKQSEFEGLMDADGIGTRLQNLYANVDIYENSILLMNTRFLSPISPLSPTFYRFYIMDTSLVDGKRCINLAFYPRSKSDLTFVGNLFITDDSIYAVRKVKLSLPEDVNINFLNSLALEQDFIQLPDSTWTLNRDEIIIDFGLGDSLRGYGIYGKRVTSYKDHVFNKALPEDIYAGPILIIKRPKHEEQAEDFWQKGRHEILSKDESGVYQMFDSIQHVPEYKRIARVVGFLTSEYWDFGKFEMGPYTTLVSNNAIEGIRTRVGFRTTRAFNQKLKFEGYVAYGFKDQEYKYSGAVVYQFNKSFFNEFPQNAIKLSYTRDVEVPGQSLLILQADNFLTSFRRGVFDKLYYKKTLALSYNKEFESSFSYLAMLQNFHLRPGGVLDFLSRNTENVLVNDGELVATEALINFRFAPNESFFQGKTIRRRITNKHPIFQLQVRAGVANDANNHEYTYQSISADIFKRFYLTPFGYTDLILEGGRTFGKVPYPLLTTHRANQSYSLEQASFNLMNAMEFVSDKYVSLNLTHYFDGFLLNKIPLIKKLKWREIIAVKGVYGGLDAGNDPRIDDVNLFRFPKDPETGRPATYSLEKEPYVEASVGISNIFKCIRLDLIRRLTYVNNDHPNVSPYGVRFKFRVEF